MASAPALPALNGVLHLPTDEETLALFTPADAAAAASDPERPEGQAIASVVLDRPEREDSAQATLDAAGALPEASAALIEALLNNAGAATQPPR